MTIAHSPTSSPPANRDVLAFRRSRRERGGESNDYVLLLGLRPQPAFSLLARVERGFDFSSFERLRESLGASTAELLAALSLPERTLARRRKAGRLSAEESDRLLRVARVFGRALELFDGDAEAAREWLTGARRALGGRVPLELVATDLGAREVEALAGRIEHGVFG